MQTKDESKLINKKKEVISGTILTITGGILWGISGVCGQFLFQNKEVTASWLVPIRLVTAGLLWETKEKTAVRRKFYGT